MRCVRRCLGRAVGRRFTRLLVGACTRLLVRRCLISWSPFYVPLRSNTGWDSDEDERELNDVDIDRVLVLVEVGGLGNLAQGVASFLFTTSTHRLYHTHACRAPKRRAAPAMPTGLRRGCL